MSGQIDGIGNDGGGGVGLRRGPRQHGDGVGNAERKAASVAAAGRNARAWDRRHAMTMVRIRPDASGRSDQADGELLAIGKMQRDVAAIVDIGALERRLLHHRAENFLRDAAGDRRHRRDEMIGGKRRHRGMHAARDRALQQAPRRIGGLAQQRQLVAEFVEQAGETAGPRRA